MRRLTTGLLALLMALSFTAPAFARAVVRAAPARSGTGADAQGAVLPGVTVTATSPSALMARRPR